METYDDVTLTEEEIKFALAEALKDKIKKLKLEAYNRKLREEIKLPIYSSEQMLEKFKKEMIGWEVDQWNEQIIWKLCLYFTRDERCAEFGMNLTKGILLQGPVGCGKSSLMNFFRRNQSNSFVITSTEFIAEQFAKESYQAIERFSYPIKQTEKIYQQEFFGQLFDDLGEERDKANFANRENVMLIILKNRYRNVAFKYTHITTNLTAEEIEQRYDDRLRSRLREMCNVLKFDPKAPDRRK